MCNCIETSPTGKVWLHIDAKYRKNSLFKCTFLTVVSSPTSRNTNKTKLLIDAAAYFFAASKNTQSFFEIWDQDELIIHCLLFDAVFCGITHPFNDTTNRSSSRLVYWVSLKKCEMTDWPRSSPGSNPSFAVTTPARPTRSCKTSGKMIISTRLQDRNISNKD